MTTKELIQVAQWIDEGVCEYSTEGNVWIKYPEKNRHAYVSTSERFTEYRRKPQPKYRPWTPEEVPFDAIFKSVLGSKYRLAHLTSDGNYSFANCPNLCADIGRLLEYEYQHSLDHGVTWKPCGVEIK